MKGQPVKHTVYIGSKYAAMAGIRANLVDDVAENVRDEVFEDVIWRIHVFLQRAVSQ